MEDRIVKIICGKEEGTAFFIASDLLLTAFHVVCDYSDESLHFIKHRNIGDLSYVVLDNWDKFDVSLIKLDTPIDINGLPLLSSVVKIGDDLSGYGYPAKSSSEGLRVHGHVSQKLSVGISEYRVSIDGMKDGFNYEGISGAPLWRDDKVIGIVIEQSGNGLNFVNIASLKEKLSQFSVIIEEEENLNDIPGGLQIRMDAIIPNYQAYVDLSNCIHHDGSWIVMTGSPGSGKTTIAAGFNPVKKDIEVIGRYFFKVPGDNITRAERCSERHFIDWLESVYSLVTGIVNELLSQDKKKTRIVGWVNEISETLSKVGKIGVIIIDGIDELVHNNVFSVESMTSLLMAELPPNIKIVLSCISEQILPSSLISILNKDQRVVVSPLDIVACESYIKNNSGDWEKPFSFVQAVANRTEGHPLYMEYLCRYIENTFGVDTREEVLQRWIDSLPSIGGHIECYYKAIWESIATDATAIEVLGLLSQARGAITHNTLFGMANASVFEIAATMKRLRHLMKSDASEVYEIYHSSFSIYISDQLKPLLCKINDQISAFCIKQPEEVYSIENHIHHKVNGSTPAEGIKECNQVWADICAREDVSPDLVMHDIKECLGKAVDQVLPVEVIRLMLLAQRIETRYDSIFVENAEIFAEINIALGKPEVALKYLIREDKLIVEPIINAVSYVQELIEGGYIHEAEILRACIESSIRRAIQNGNGQCIAPNVLVTRAMTFVEAYYAGLITDEPLMSFFDLIYTLKENAEDEESLELLNEINKIVVSWQMSRKLRNNIDIDWDKFLSMAKIRWCKEVVLLIIYSLMSFKDRNNFLSFIVRNEAYQASVKKVEQILNKTDFEYTREELSQIIRILIADSKETALVRKLIDLYSPSTGTLSFRASNGVDFDLRSLENHSQEVTFRAYSDKVFNLSNVIISNWWNVKTWENNLLRIVEYVAYLKGYLYRLYAEGSDIDREYERLKGVLNAISFSFEQRSHWQRSYLLPESLLPYVYRAILDLYHTYYPNKIDDFVNHVRQRSDNQLSLYIEGYCETLCAIVDYLAERKCFCSLALDFSNLTFGVVVYALKNRSQKSKSLLRLAKIYAVLGDKEHYNKVFQELLNSSMGPEWYKEDQMGLLNHFAKYNIQFTANQVCRAAAIFEEASGEMTFQRYVQQEKHTFVAMLASRSSLTDAISYYKYETLPSSEVVKHNAEDWKVDMPSLGNGYNLGANHLIEASALHQMLYTLPNVSPYISYALSELHWGNWDWLHNDFGYAKLHAKLLNNIEVDFAKQVFVPRMADYYVSNCKGFNNDYLSEFERTIIDPSIVDAFAKQLNVNGFDWHPTPQKEATQKESSTGRDKRNIEEYLSENKNEIVSPTSVYWYSLSHMLGDMIEKSEARMSDFYHIITEHLDINVGTPKDQYDKFSFLQGFVNGEDYDAILIRFLIWHTVHPDSKIVNRAKDAVKWLATHESNVFVGLINEILVPQEVGTDTISSAILRDLAEEHSTVIVELLQEHNTVVRLSEIHNFSVSYNLFLVAKTLKDKEGFCELYDLLVEIFPNKLPIRGEVCLDNKYTIFIDHIIDKLNYHGVTGGKDFAIPYMEIVKPMYDSAEIENLITTDKYIQRSFYLNTIYDSRYNRTMMSIIDGILYGKVDIAKAGTVYYIINNE